MFLRAPGDHTLSSTCEYPLAPVLRLSLDGLDSFLGPAFSVLSKGFRLVQSFACRALITSPFVEHGDLVVERSVGIVREGLLQLCYGLQRVSLGCEDLA